MERYVAAADNGVTVIGEVVAAADKPIVRVLDAEGRDMVLANRGWDHFATA
jgi:hypothetical protein